MVIQPQDPLAKVANPRKISELFKNPAENPVTQEFLADVRRTVYTWAKLVTTRPCETNESSENYEFVAKSAFEQTARNGGFVEWMQHVNGHYFGIPCKPIPRASFATTSASTLQDQLVLSKSREQLLLPTDDGECCWARRQNALFLTTSTQSLRVAHPVPDLVDSAEAVTGPDVRPPPASPTTLIPSTDIQEAISRFSGEKKMSARGGMLAFVTRSPPSPPPPSQSPLFFSLCTLSLHD